MYPRYEQYQDSGVAWLGEVPSHWEVKRLRFVLEVNPVKSELNLPDETTVSFIPMDAVNFDKNLTLTQEKSLDEVYKGYTFFRDNDVLLAKITPCFENGKSAIAQNLTNGIGFGTTELHVLRANGQFNNHFLYYLLKTDLFMKLGESQMYGAGGQKRISEEFIKNFSLGIPPLPEQTTIAAFLDCKLAQIDALISKQETLLAKLAEKRTALITHAVTRGLNPTAPLKPSGVAWLGEVPSHWEVKKGNQIFIIHNGATPKTSESDYWGDEIVWITPKDLGDCKAKEIGESAKMITQAGYENCGVSLAPPNSLALSKRAPIGHLAKTTVSAVVNQGCFLLEIQDNSSNADYFYYLLTGYKDVLNSFGQGSTFMELPREKFAMLKMPFPPLPEQTAIAHYLDTQTAQIDALSNKIRQTIARLQEYRRTLITQAVTGKIKVIGEHR